MPSTVGVDIGSSAVRAVEVSSAGRAAKVRKAGRVPLPPGAVEGGVVRDAPEVTKALKRLWHEQKFGTKEVRLAVGSASVLVRPVELEWMPAPDLRKAMRYLVAELLPVPVDQANIDHVHLGEVERDGRRMARVLLVATARDGVDDMVRCVRAAGLRPSTADLSPLALVRAAARSVDGDAGVVEAVVDVGADKVSVAVHHRGLPRFVRVIPSQGGAALTRAVAAATGEDDRAAEERKHATPLQGHDVAAVALRQAAERLAHEVRDTLAFHSGSDPEHPAARVVLAGVGGTGPGFAELLADTVGLPVRLMPEVPVGRRDNEPTADLTVSYGLCLGATA